MYFTKPIPYIVPGLVLTGFIDLLISQKVLSVHINNMENNPEKVIFNFSKYELFDA